jgi:hypothetical protein
MGEIGERTSAKAFAHGTKLGRSKGDAESSRDSSGDSGITSSGTGELGGARMTGERAS